MAAGYSGTPLIKKLGITHERKILLINQPKNYFDLIGEDITRQLCKIDKKPDLIHLFVSNKDDFETQMKSILKVLQPTIVIWVSWYKKSSGIKTDISEDMIRNYSLQNGLVDVKVCAVSELWSGLKLVVPLKKRFNLK
ncbi:MAG: DUF3052 domain-containing protein [Bacteroidota bacterium]|nr:DUF3052 domain-containing protein [Bacteroidota bacterium]